MLKFFRGEASLSKLRTVMKRSSKLRSLLEIIESYTELRDAVCRLKDESAEKIAEETGIPTFELLYISKAKP